MSFIAITRGVGPLFAECELTHLARQPIDVDRARRQHADYVGLLGELGCRVETLPPEPHLADAVFVEDIAVVVDELAVVTRPGAASRRPERASVASTLARHRPLERIEPPATLDGGDVLRVGRQIWVGLSERTTPQGVAQLAALLQPRGYTVREVPVRGCLHLKSGVTAVAEGRLLLNPDWVDRQAFDGFEVLEVDPTEPFAANALSIGGTVIFPAAHRRTRDRLTAAGIEVRTVDVSEIAKAEGGVTCCSLLFSR